MALKFSAKSGVCVPKGDIPLVPSNLKHVVDRPQIPLQRSRFDHLKSLVPIGGEIRLYEGLTRSYGTSDDEGTR